VITFVLISQRTAKIFAYFPPLKAYTLDIAGSCCGILCFMLMSWLKIPAYEWFILLIPLFVIAFDKTTSINRVLFYIPLIAVMSIVCYQNLYFFARPDNYELHTTTWSPYQRIDFIISPGDHRSISVNGINHQTLLDSQRIEHSFYKLPYLTRKETGKPAYEKILIIGAGAGNDTAAALTSGATHIDAVEIDPSIAELGRKYHPAMPYQNKSVNLIIDDGRSFMTNTKQRYDLIIFALTDSLIKASPLAQLRLENYLFTKQSVQRACSLLNKDGDVVFYNYYREPWLISKMYSMISQVSGRPPIILARYSDFIIFKTQMSAPESAVNHVTGDSVDIPTDDWPFLYLQKKGIPGLYVKSMIGLVSVVVFLMILLNVASRKRKDLEKGFSAFALKISFILMGMAFLLLETKSVVQFSLLFGTTWLNSSLVFLSVLLLVLAANWTARIVQWKYFLPAAYVLLTASCLITLIYPLSNLLYYENRVLRLILAILLLFLPIYFANLMFSIIFRDQKTAEHYFGWNLFGATLGGVMEYFSMALGYNMLAIIVALCYASAFLFLIAAKIPRFAARNGANQLV